MVWKDEPHIEEIEKMRMLAQEKIEVLEKLPIKTSSKTYRGYLNGLIKKFSTKKDATITGAELLVFLRELLDKFNHYYPQKIVKVEVEILSGWKGKGTIDFDFNEFTEDVTIKYPLKDKDTGKVKWAKHTITKENINRIFKWIKEWELGEMHSCHEFAGILGESDWAEVWKKRTKVYFAKYYFPIKVLETVGMIQYTGKGDITRIR